MLSKIPFKMEELRKDEINREALRVAVIAELDAINLYEQLASVVDDEKIRKILLDVAKEEKTHVGEFLTLLLEFDEEQREELRKGEEEVKEILGE
ncbi:MAG: rubrerythrin [Archaeoglobi archaeon]|nr:rubrerythrin [Candidatus Mnemosynella sp.]